MRIRVLIITIASAVALAAGIQSEGQVVVQLDTHNFSAEELGRLSAELLRLEDLLGDQTLGPQRQLGQDGWTPQSFAEFSAGSLAERGYDVVLARDVQRAWILVALVINGRTVWIPIEPSPATGTTQATLGRVPFLSPDSGSLLMESQYLLFASTSVLAQNLGPTADFRISDTVVEVNASVLLDASASWDPDGTIVLYRWCIGGTPCVAMTSWSFVSHANTPGDRRVTLIVVDNAGRSASTELFFSVRGEVPDSTRSPLYDPADCGCGG